MFVLSSVTVLLRARYRSTPGILLPFFDVVGPLRHFAAGGSLLLDPSHPIVREQRQALGLVLALGFENQRLPRKLDWGGTRLTAPRQSTRVLGLFLRKSQFPKKQMPRSMELRRLSLGQ
jgi:hypothetical protein